MYFDIRKGAKGVLTKILRDPILDPTSTPNRNLALVPSPRTQKYAQASLEQSWITATI